LWAIRWSTSTHVAGSPNAATVLSTHLLLAERISIRDLSTILPLIALSAKWEQAFAESLVGQGEERSLAMQPSKLSEFMTVVRDRFEQAAREGEAPAGDLGGDPAVRAFAGGALPFANHRVVAGGNPSAGAAEDSRQRLIVAVISCN